MVKRGEEIPDTVDSTVIEDDEVIDLFPADADPEMIASRMASMQLANRQRELNREYKSMDDLVFLSESVDEEGELVDHLNVEDSLEEDEDVYYTGTYIGMLEKPVSDTLMRSDYFPSKVGGKPAWLNTETVPCVRCRTCGDKMAFQSQLYTPLPETAKNAEAAFHRMVYIFTCKTAECLISNSSVQVFRCQVPLVNPFFPAEPPVDAAKAKASELGSEDMMKGVHCCVACGHGGDMHTCTECSQSYCEEHIHMKQYHSGSCNTKQERNTLVFPCLEIVMEEEGVESDFLAAGHKEQALEQQYHAEQANLTDQERKDDAEAALALTDEFAGTGDADQVFIDFQARTSYNPEQIMRYLPYQKRVTKLNNPLWCGLTRRLAASSVPKCDCGADRVLESQMMPQLVYFFEQAQHQNSMGSYVPTDFDYGTICVYTCKDSCGVDMQYKEEFAYVQPPQE